MRCSSVAESPVCSRRIVTREPPGAMGLPVAFPHVKTMRSGGAIIEHFTHYFHCVGMPDVYLPAGRRFDSGTRAPPLGPTRAVGKVTEHGLARRLNLHSSFYFIVKPIHGSAFLGSRLSIRSGSTPRFFQLRLQLQGPEFVVPHLFQHLAQRAQCLAPRPIKSVPALSARLQQPRFH